MREVNFNVNCLLAGKFTNEIAMWPRGEAPLGSTIEIFRRKSEIVLKCISKEEKGEKVMSEFNSVEELGLCVLHVGINNENAEEAGKVAEEFHTLMGFIPKEGNSSYFASPLIEVMKSKGPGKNGHIAIGAHDVAKAAEYFRSTGMGVKEDTAKYDENGEMIFVYLEKEIGGFAIHLKKY